MAIVLALDFGGSKHTVGVIQLPLSEEKPTWIAHRVEKSPPNPNAQVDLEIILRIADQALAGKQPDAIGVSFGGPVDASKNQVLLSHHVPGWENFFLGDYLQQRYSCPVKVDNDANVAALGEYRFGAGRGCSSLLYITISTGVGGGWILDHKIWHGANRMAGEIGHMTVDPLGPLCLCGKRGCVERLASGPYLAQEARERLMKNPNLDSSLRRATTGNLVNITSTLIAQAAAEGDALARDIIRRGARAIGVAIGNAANLVNPERFILGGGVIKSGELFWNELRKAAQDTALPQVKIEIHPAALGDDSPLWGTVALVETCPGIK